jgi:hypothetical protein
MIETRRRSRPRPMISFARALIWRTSMTDVMRRFYKRSSYAIMRNYVVAKEGRIGENPCFHPPVSTFPG